MSSTHSKNADAMPTQDGGSTIADRIAENRKRADELFATHRDWLRNAHHAVQHAEPAASRQLCEEIDQRKQQWLEIQDRVCEQQEAFWQEFQHREAALHIQTDGDSNDHELEELRNQLEGLHTELQGARTELAEWQSRCQRAESEAETAIKQAADHQVDSTHHEVLLDQAETLAELHELRDENATLRKRLAQPAPAESSGQFNWEQHKQQMLNELAGEDGQPLPSIQATPQGDELAQRAQDELHSRDEQIEELNRRIAEQAEHLLALEERDIEAVHIKPAEIEQLVADEREKLAGLQAEWREMLRKAEVEISIERAKLARDKRQLENEVGGYQEEITNLKRDVENLRAGRETSRGGNWLSRLGLGGQK